MADEREGESFGIAGVAVVASVAWLACSYWLVSSTKSCSIGGDFLEAHVYCLAPDALGDILAGAFAPLAFIWLVAAVLLQRVELALQRKELQLARSVSADQADEARRNVRLIAEQTAMLREDQRRADLRSVDADIDELIDLLRKQCRQELSPIAFGRWPVNVDPATGGKVYAFEFRVPADEDPYQECGAYVRMMYVAVTVAQGIVKDGGQLDLRGGIVLLESSTRVAEMVTSLASRASETKRARLQAVVPDAVVPLLNKLQEYMLFHSYIVPSPADYVPASAKRRRARKVAKTQPSKRVAK